MDEEMEGADWWQYQQQLEQQQYEIAHKHQHLRTYDEKRTEMKHQPLLMMTNRQNEDTKHGTYRNRH